MRSAGHVGARSGHDDRSVGAIGLGRAADRPAFPRLTFAVADAPALERELTARGVRISDPVQAYEEGRFRVGACLDSEGNKLWFCSAAAP